MGLTPLDEIDQIVASREVGALAREIAEHAITLVRNDDKLVPLSKLKADARIFNLAITNGDDRAWIANQFTGAITRLGRTIETIVLDERSSEIDVQKAIEKATGADIVIASLYGRVRSGQARSVGLPESDVAQMESP